MAGRRGPSDREIKALVREGWDQRSFLYRPSSTNTLRDATGHTERQYRAWLAPLFEAVPNGSRVLDLGCGSGRPTSLLLSRRYQVTGIDISGVQIERAKQLVPSARFVRQDMTKARLPPGSLGAVVSLYATIHVPLREQRPLFRRIWRWLAPGGIFLSVLGAGRYRGIERGWLGSEAPMFWDHASADTYQRWLEAAGFEVEHRKYVPEGEGGHELFRCRKVTGGHPSRPAHAAPARHPRTGRSAGR